jgi:hypothetical protein
VIFVGHQDQRETVDVGAFMYCSNTGWAFGPLFDSADDCREFMAWMDRDKGGEVDPRTLQTKELHELHSRWLVETRRAV